MDDRTGSTGRGGQPRTPRRPPAPPRPPAYVFWIRRLVVLGLPLLLIVLLVVWLTGRGGSDAPSDASTPTPSPTAAPSPTPTPEAGVPDCAPEQLALTLAPAAESFVGTEPTFEVTVTNSGTEPCLVDAGEAGQEVLVTSGEDRVWSSRDCVAPDTPPRTLLLAGGQSDVTSLTWSRVRSAPGCPGDLPAPGAGTYSATVSMGGATSPVAVFGLG